MPTLTRIAAVSDVPPSEGREFTVGDRILAVYNVDGEFHVLDGICPHAGGPLGAGALDGCIVTCPWHGWQFDVTTGRHCLSDRIQQQRYECHIDDGQLLVEIPEDN